MTDINWQSATADDGRTYYYNVATGATTWTPPERYQPPPPPPPPPPEDSASRTDLEMHRALGHFEAEPTSTEQLNEEIAAIWHNSEKEPEKPCTPCCYLLVLACLLGGAAYAGMPWLNAASSTGSLLYMPPLPPVPPLPLPPLAPPEIPSSIPSPPSKPPSAPAPMPPHVVAFVSAGLLLICWLSLVTLVCIRCSCWGEMLDKAWAYCVRCNCLGSFIVLIVLFIPELSPGAPYGWPYGHMLFLIALSCVTCVGWHCQNESRENIIRYREIGVEGKELNRLLATGTLRLISIEWLLAQPEEWIACRRQDLPPEAFLSADEAATALAARAIAVLSYRWLTAAHPDPDAFHLRAVRHALRTLRDDPKHQGLAALFMDYLSCPQKDAAGHRTEAENRVFKLCIQHMGSLYASPRTLVLQHKQLPANFPAEQPTYDQSGWCNFEQAVARLLCDERDGGAKILQIPLEADTTRVASVSYTRPTLAEMDALFQDESRTRFQGRADRETVAQLYRSFAEHVVELKYEKQPFCIKLSEHHVKRQGRCMGSIGVCVSLLLLFQLLFGSVVTFLWKSEDGGIIGNPFWAFLYFAIVNGVMLCCMLQDRVFLCLCSPTYRFRWRSCLWRLLCFEGLGNGPDPPDQMRFVVYGERGPPRGHRDRATVAPEG